MTMEKTQTEKPQVQKFVQYRLVKEPVTQAYQANSMKIKFAKDVYEYAKRLYNGDIGVYESFHAIYLNRQNHIIGHVRISQGGLISTHVDVRLIGKCALELLATSIILIHNHPSGNLDVSEADIKMTNKIKNMMALHDVEILDHLILSEESYCSFAEKNLI